MGILAPTALALLSLAVPIVALYMLRFRRPRVQVSSLVLWEQPLHDHEANAPWQRLRANWLLIIQLIILALLVLAAAQPFRWLAGSATGNTIIVLDGSASMRSRDVAPSRFDAATAAARTLIEHLGAEQQIGIVLAGPAPLVLQPATSDRTALLATLERVEAGYGASSIDDAVALAGALAQRLPQSSVIVFSDGAFPSLTYDATVPVEFRTIGQSGENIGITAVHADGAGSLFARVSNKGQQTARVLVSVLVDGSLLDAREVELTGGGDAGLRFDHVPADAHVLQVEVEANDILPVDDRAWVTPLAARAETLLVTSETGTFLERALALMPGISLSRGGDSAGCAAYAWCVLDGVPPADVSTNLLVIDPPGSDLLPATDETLRGVRATHLASEHPILKGVDLTRLVVSKARVVETPPWAVPIVMAGDAPLILAGEREGHRVILLTFDLRDSDLPLQVAFPVLLDNIRAWLLRAEPGAASVRPGDPVLIPVPAGIDGVVVLDPAGREHHLTMHQQQAHFAATSQPGPYHLSLQTSGTERQAYWLTVNLVNDAESDVAPVAHPSLGAARDLVTNREASQQEIWPAVLLAGVLLLTFEWWFFLRGGFGSLAGSWWKAASLLGQWSRRP